MFLPGTGFLHSINPWTKVVLSSTLILLAFIGPLPEFLSIGILVLVILPVSVRAGLGQSITGILYRLVLPTVLALFIAQGLFYPGAKNVLFQIGCLSVKQEGIIFAWITGTRFAVLLTAASLVTLSTSPGALMGEMSKRRFPASLSYLVVSAIQILPLMKKRADNIASAQRARGLDTQGNILMRMKGILPLVMPLIFSSLVDSEERAIALQARAFNSGIKPTSFIEIPDSKLQGIVRLFCPLLILLAVVGRVFL